MSQKSPEFTGEVIDNLNPSKTVRAVNSRKKLPPLICLVCFHSEEKGDCQNKDVDRTMVEVRWEKQWIVDELGFKQSLISDTSLNQVCSEFLAE